MIELYDFQRADVNELLAHDATGFIVAETGAGKTVIGAATALETGLPVRLIIAPQGTHKEVWRRTIRELDPEAEVFRIDGSVPGKEVMSDLELKRPGWYLVTPQLFTRWKFTTTRADVVLLDEAHQLANRESAGGMALRKLSAGHRIPLSGTMYGNRFQNFWNLLRWVYADQSGPGELADIAYRRWEEAHCETAYDHFAVGNIKVVGEKVPGSIANAIPCYVQHFKREQCCEFHPEGFLHDLPAPIHITETVQLTTGQKKAIHQVETDYVAWLETEAKERRAIHVKLPLVKQTRLSQMTLGMPSLQRVPKTVIDPETGLQKVVLKDRLYFEPDCESPKFDKLVEIHDKVGEPMVVATNSKEFVDMAVPRLNAMGKRTFGWTGDASQTARDEALAAFKRGEYDIIMGVTEAIGTGIDGFQDASGVLVSMNRSRNLTSETQLLGRQDRRGQVRKEGVIHYEIIAEGSDDEAIIGAQLAATLRRMKSLRRELRRQEAA